MEFDYDEGTDAEKNELISIQAIEILRLNREVASITKDLTEVESLRWKIEQLEAEVQMYKSLLKSMAESREEAPSESGE